LAAHGSDFLAPVRQILKEAKTRETKSPLSITRIIVEEKGSEHERPCLHVSCLKDHIIESWNRLLDSEEVYDDPKFNDKIWVALSGDQGGGTTKLTLHFLNVKKPNSVHNMHIIGNIFYHILYG